MSEQTPSPRELGLYYALAQAGTEMVIPLGLGALLDYWLGWSPWAAVAGAVIGFTGGMVHLISMANAIERERAKKKKNDS